VVDCSLGGARPQATGLLADLRGRRSLGSSRMAGSGAVRRSPARTPFQIGGRRSIGPGHELRAHRDPRPQSSLELCVSLSRLGGLVVKAGGAGAADYDQLHELKFRVIYCLDYPALVVTIPAK